MSREEAITHLAEGHSLWSVEMAKTICRSFDLPFPKQLIIRWRDQHDANPTKDPKGIWLHEPDQSGEGVGSIELSNYVAQRLGVRVRDYFGRGSQAAANAKAIRKYLALD
jgi:hypothetical protein